MKYVIFLFLLIQILTDCSSTFKTIHNGQVEMITAMQEK